MSENGEPDHRRLVITGSGIAGLTAAIYAARSNNDPLVLEGDEPGGQLTLTTDVANYPGFPDGIGGSELVQNMQDPGARTSGPRFDTASSNPSTTRLAPSNSPSRAASRSPRTRSSSPAARAHGCSASRAKTT